MVLWNNVKGYKEVVCNLHFRDEQIEAHQGYNELKVIQFTLEKLTLESLSPNFLMKIESVSQDSVLCSEFCGAFLIVRTLTLHMESEDQDWEDSD